MTETLPTVNTLLPQRVPRGTRRAVLEFPQNRPRHPDFLLPAHPRDPLSACKNFAELHAHAHGCDLRGIAPQKVPRVRHTMGGMDRTKSGHNVVKRRVEPRAVLAARQLLRLTNFCGT